MIISFTLSAEVIHVPEDRPTIQAGIDAAIDGDTVLVANGTYTGPGNRDLDFKGKAITVRSENGPYSCIIDCGGSAGNRHRGFYFHSIENQNSVVQGFTIRNGFEEYGGGIYCYNASPAIRNNILQSNGCEKDGGGIGCRGTTSGSALITGNVILENEAGQRGGGILCANQFFPVISNNIIQENRAISGGGGGIACILTSSLTISNNQITANTARSAGGISVQQSEAVITDNIISENSADYANGGNGGGISCAETTSTMQNNLITGNHGYAGGGVFIGLHGYPTLINNSIIGNAAELGGGLYTNTHSQTNRPLITNSILWDNIPDAVATEDVLPRIIYSDIEGGYAGTGNMDEDPLFLTGPFGEYYLSQTAAGQAWNSPCMDAGNPDSETVWGTTRTDSRQDQGIMDMGYHHRLPEGTFPDTLILSGPSGVVDSPVFTFTFTGEDAADPPSALVFSFSMDDGPWSPYSSAAWATFSGLNEGAHTFQVRARNRAGHFDPTPASRTFTAETWDRQASWIHLVTGPGPGPYNPPLVRSAHGQWLAYGNAKYGVHVACGCLEGVSVDEVVTGPGPGTVFGPHVRGWDIYGNPFVEVNFLAYGTHKYGVNVATGDIDRDGFDEIITGPGPGAVFGPHVRGWNCDGAAVTSVGGVNFLAYGTHKWGVNVYCGDIDGDAYDEVITGPGPGPIFGPHVRAWDYDGSGSTSPVSDVSFFAYSTRKYGVNVASGDLNASGVDEIITGPGPGPMFGANVRTWAGSNLEASFFAYGTRFGVVVAAGNVVDSIWIEEILTMPGPGSFYTAHAKAWNENGGSAVQVPSVNFVAYDSWMTYGGNIAAVNLR